MTILFLCGSLEPARDGVGDYTRRLAGELQRQGHRVAILALADKQLVDVDEQLANQTDNEQLINTLRLSERLPWRERVRRAGGFINDFGPNLLSLQYVPFSFQPKGLPVGFDRVLTALRGERPLQIMFHELWLGLPVQSPWQHRPWGYVQRQLIRQMLATQRPAVVHTHTPLYQLELERLGVKTVRLPLFTNIANTATQRTQPSPTGALRFVLFGGAFPGAPAQSLANEVAAYARQHRLDASLTLVGRNGAEQKTWATAWRTNGLDVQTLGEQSPADISDVLSRSDIGLSTTPVALWGKSGAIAAMHAHGLPVLCASAPWQPRRQPTLPTAPGILDYRAGQLAAVLQGWQDLILPRIDVSHVASQFVADVAGATAQAVRQLYPPINQPL